MSFAGTPPKILNGEMLLVTTEPAPMMQPSPIVTPESIFTFEPIRTSCPIWVRGNFAVKGHNDEASAEYSPEKIDSYVNG